MVVLLDKRVDMVQILYKIKLDLLSISIVTRLWNGRSGDRFAVEADYLLFTFPPPPYGPRKKSSLTDG